MKHYYLIYSKNNQYLGYATEKKMLTRFLEIRGRDTYKYVKISKKDFLKNIVSPDILYDTKLEYMDLAYNPESPKIPIFVWEYAWLNDVLEDILNEINDTITSILITMDYIKFTKKEKKIIRSSFESLFEITHDMLEALANEPIYDEMFNLENVFKHSKFTNSDN